ncbi:MAG: heat-inducible transcriptional repressor HrcA [Candidatus Bipolaricaulis sp.]
MQGRRARLLIEVVDRYIRTRQPVSSRELVTEYRHRFSPATIRNELLALEGEGYLVKPYPSAGRVPTAQGFKFFAEWLLDLAKLGEGPSSVPAERHEVELGMLPDLFRSAATLLAAMTRELGFVIPPPREHMRTSSLFVRRVRPGAVLAVTVSELGTVESRLLPLDLDLAPEELAEAEGFLSRWLQEHTLAESPLGARPVPEGWHSRAAVAALAILRQLAEREPDRGLYVEGWPHLLAELAVRSPEWALDRGQALLRVLEEGTAFVDLVRALGKDHGQEIAVHVGDGSIPELADLSLVSAPYLGGSGVAGVLGPLWMDYARALSAARYVAGRLGALLAAGSTKEEG